MTHVDLPLEKELEIIKILRDYDTLSNDGKREAFKALVQLMYYQQEMIGRIFTM